MSQIIITTPEELSALLDERLRLALKQFTQPIPDNVPGEAGQSYISKQTAAKLIGCCIATLDNARRAGKIKAHKIGGGKSVRFDRNEVLALLETKPRQRQGRN